MIKYLLLLVLALASCSENPVTGKSELHLISESQEIAIGEENYLLMQQAEGGAYLADPKVQEYVAKVGNKLAAVSDRPDLPYEFVVLDNSVPNAWSLPGGKIGINRGLLVELESEAELAAVLSHEIVHSAARHGAQMMERALLMEAGLVGLDQLLKGHKYEDTVVGGAAVGAGLLSLKYSRTAELEADAYGIKYMVAAGYNPQAAVELQKTFLRLSEGNNPEWFGGLFSTHPPSEERLLANEQTIAQYPPGGRSGVAVYAAMMKELREAQPAYDDLDNGYRAFARGRASDAFLLAEKGIKIAPREAHLYNLKGKAEMKLGHPKLALASFNQALSLNPNYFDFYLQRGLLEYEQGDFRHARRDLNRSNDLLPSADAHYVLGEIYLHQGDKQQAIAHFQMAAHADSPAGQKARARLDRFNIRNRPGR